MLEIVAATWWVWLILSLLSFLAVGVNSLLVTYGTAIDVAGLAYQATKISREDLPPNPIKGDKEEWHKWGGKTLGVVKNEAVKRTKSYAIDRATRKIRKIFFGVILLGFGIINAVFFVISVVTALALAAF
jgi:hypothetical protein